MFRIFDIHIYETDTGNTLNCLLTMIYGGKRKKKRRQHGRIPFAK